MSSQKSTSLARTPQRARGHERVAALRRAAVDCFVDKGYDAATMTEIAARADAAIGSLYQFFPTREALAEALLEECTQALFERLAKLATQAEGRDVDWLAAQLIRFLVAFRRRHPVFVVLIDSVSMPAERGMAIRRRLRDELQALLGRHLPRLPAAELRAATVAVQQLMKAAVAVNAEPGLPGRQAALDQLERVLALYLRTLTHG